MNEHTKIPDYVKTSIWLPYAIATFGVVLGLALRQSGDWLAMMIILCGGAGIWIASLMAIWMSFSCFMRELPYRKLSLISGIPSLLFVCITAPYLLIVLLVIYAFNAPKDQDSVDQKEDADDLTHS
jgi:uncharacterized membrane protein